MSAVRRAVVLALAALTLIATGSLLAGHSSSTVRAGAPAPAPSASTADLTWGG